MIRTVLPVALLALVLSGAAPRAQPVPADEFEAFSAGRTLYFTRDGQPFGAERFLPGRRTLWRFDGGPCLDGAWHAEGDRICFAYADDPGAQCWRFLRDGARLRAVLVEPSATRSAWISPGTNRRLTDSIGWSRSILASI